MIKAREEKNSADIPLRILQSAVIVLALFAKIRVLPHDGSEYPIIAFLAKTRDSFEEMSFASPLVFILFLLLLRETRRRRLKNNWQIVVLSGVFALLYVLARSTKELGSIAFVTANAYQLFISSVCILGYWMMFDLMLRWALYFAERAESEAPAAVNGHRLWLVFFAVLFILRLPWLFASYPASFCFDSVWQLNQGLGYTEVTLHHPPLSTAIMTLCVKLGAMIKSENFGCFIYVVIQTLMNAAVFAYILVVLRRMGVGKKLRAAAFLFYALLPVWGAYCQWFEKDLLYTNFYALTVVLLIEAMHTGKLGKKRAAAIGVLTAVTCLLRNNAVYELFPFLLLLVFFIPRRLRKRMLCICLASLVLTYSVTSAVYPLLGFKKGSVAEMLSIPFQQTARYVVSAGEEVTEHEREVIDSVLSYDDMEEDYLWYVSDPIKAKYHGDSDALREYFKVWLSMGMKHPLIYFDALIGMSYGYIAPVKPFISPDIPVQQETAAETGVPGITRRASDFFPVLLNVILSNISSLPVVRFLTAAGTYSWIMLACAVLLWVKKRYYAMLPTIPGILNIFICILSPMSDEIRYNLSAIALAPLIICWTVLNISSVKKEKQGENNG